MLHPTLGSELERRSLQTARDPLMSGQIPFLGVFCGLGR